MADTNYTNILGSRLAHRFYYPLLGVELAEGIDKIIFTPGCGARVKGMSGAKLSFWDYYQTYVLPLLESGVISDGTHSKYDDRKLRFSSYRIRGSTLEIKVGPTYYQHYKKELEQTEKEAVRTFQKGIRMGNDPFLYFSRALAVTMVPLSSSGTAYIGERNKQVDRSGYFAFAGGLMEFRMNPGEVRVLDDVLVEMGEELEVAPQNISNVRFIGMAGECFSGEVDLVFVVQTDLPDAHFEDLNPVEHHSLIPIGKQEHCLEMLSGKYPLLYSAVFGLEYLSQYHFS